MLLVTLISHFTLTSQMHTNYNFRYKYFQNMNNKNLVNNLDDILDAVDKNLRVGGVEDLEPVAREQRRYNIYFFIMQLYIDDIICTYLVLRFIINVQGKISS